MENFLQLDIAAALGLTGTIMYGLFYKFLYIKVIKPHTALVNRAIDSIPKIEEMHAQFYTNGGGSMTDRMIRIENTLVAVSQRQHVYLLEHKLGIFHTDDKGECIEVNRTYCRITERTEEECLGTGWVESIHPEDVDEVTLAWEKAVKGKRDFRMNYRMVRADGEEITIFSTAHPLRNPYTKIVIGFMGTIKRVEDNGD